MKGQCNKCYDNDKELELYYFFGGYLYICADCKNGIENKTVLE